MNAADSPTRVLLVDDHAIVTEGLSTLLLQFADIDVVGTASGGAAGVDAADTLRPDVVLMDLSMPGVGGAEATRRILAIDATIRVLALTAFMDERLIGAAVHAGASGCLLKSASGEELVSAIRTVASGGTTLSQEMLRMVATSGSDEAVGDDLTPRERDVLAHLVEGRTNKQIAQDLQLSPGTVRIHVSNVLVKLQVENRTAAAVLARRLDLVVTDGEGDDAQIR